MNNALRVIEDEFDGKVAVVTGAGTGNGESIAERLYAGGASVALISRRIGPLHEVCKRIDPAGRRTFPSRPMSVTQALSGTRCSRSPERFQSEWYRHYKNMFADRL